MENSSQDTPQTNDSDGQDQEASTTVSDVLKRSAGSALYQGWKNTCPACREGKILHNYLKVHDYCATCALHLGGHRADDAPPYVTIVVTGHFLAPFWVAWVLAASPGIGVQVLTFFLLSGAMTYYLLPRIKGALIGLQWAYHMHGFSKTGDVVPDPDIKPASLCANPHLKPHEHHD